MISINEYLSNILDDFVGYVRSQDKLCELLDVHFDAGRIPNYTNIHVQQLYLLRYAYAYAFEYKCIYRKLIKRLKQDEEIDVTSIGCGNMLDYWSLAHAVKNQYDIYYTGIDTINWSYCFEARQQDSVQRFIGDAISFLQQQEELASYIYIFPKSISEFSMEEISSFGNCFTRQRVTPQSLHFLFSLRTDRGSLERDMSKTKLLYQMLIENGYHSNDDSDCYSIFVDDIKGKPIRIVDDDFQHPGDVIDFLKELDEKCAAIEHCSDRMKCEKRLTRWPILTCQYAAWQVFSFER